MKYKMTIYRRAFDPDWGFVVSREAKTFLGNSEKALLKVASAWAAKEGINLEEIETRLDFNR